MHFPSFSFSAQMGLNILLMNFAQTAWHWSPKGAQKIAGFTDPMKQLLYFEGERFHQNWIFKCEK